MNKVLENRKFEANKIYVLGLKKFIFEKYKGVKKLDKEVKEKLNMMLFNHHKNRCKKLLLLKNLKDRILETEMMIARY